jgi:hypothetical protein
MGLQDGRCRTTDRIVSNWSESTHYRGRPLADLYLALLQRAGVSIARVADSTGPLPNLTM